jgi:uncharacterized protein (DUF305 family)
MNSVVNFFQRWRGPVAALAGRIASFPASQTKSAVDERRFLSEHDEAMARMMIAMNIRPTGDVDRDFVAVMAPHHQGAIAIAESLLRYGQNEPLRRLAQEIIVSQQQEIAAMRQAVNGALSMAEP